MSHLRIRVKPNNYSTGKVVRLWRACSGTENNLSSKRREENEGFGQGNYLRFTKTNGTYQNLIRSKDFNIRKRVSSARPEIWLNYGLFTASEFSNYGNSLAFRKTNNLKGDDSMVLDRV